MTETKPAFNPKEKWRSEWNTPEDYETALTKYHQPTEGAERVFSAMIDLETLGLRNDTIVTSIGVATFDRKNLLDTFKVTLSIPAQIQQGGTVDMSTVEFWSKQNPEAKEAVWGSLFVTGEAHAIALQGLAKFLRAIPDLRVWGNDPTFDLTKLAYLFETQGIALPWRFFNERCFRTAYSMCSCLVERVKPVVPHDPAADALAQAQTLLECEKLVNRNCLSILT